MQSNAFTLTFKCVKWGGGLAKYLRTWQPDLQTQMDSEMVRFHPYIHMRKGRQLCILIFVEFVGTLGCFCLFVCFCQRSLLGDTETYSSPKYFLLHEHSLEESLAMTSNSPLMSLLEMLKYESNHSPIASLPQDTDPSNRAQGISSFPD